MGINITINGIDVRDVLEKAHLAQMVDSEKLEGRDGWMFLCGMSAMASFCADSFDELDDQAMLTEAAYLLSVASADVEGGYRERLIEVNEGMVEFVDGIIKANGGE